MAFLQEFKEGNVLDSETSSSSVSRPKSWVEPGRERSGNVMLLFHISSFFLALFLLSVMMFNKSHFFFQKPKLLLCKFKEEQIFFLGECEHLLAE